jgi:hypothetical protein
MNLVRPAGHVAGRRVATSLGAAALVLLSASPSSSAPPDERSFRSSFDCSEVVLGVTVDRAAVDDHVPDTFVIYEAAGKTELAVFTESCLVRVEDGSWNPTVVSGVLVFVRDPEGSEALHAFDLHWGTDDPAYLAALRRLGVGDHTPGSIFDLEVQTTTSEIHSEINWKRSPFAISATVLSATDERGPFESVHWLAGNHGLVRSRFPHQITVRPAQGVLTTTPGTLLHDIVGAERVTTVGVYFEFTVDDGITELVPS